MPTENDDHKAILPADIQGYAEVFESCARLVAASEHPRLAVSMILNAVLQIALEVQGREKLTHDLGIAIANLEAAAVQARGRMT